MWTKNGGKAIKLMEIAKRAEESKVSIESVRECIKVYAGINVIHHDLIKDEITLID